MRVLPLLLGAASLLCAVQPAYADGAPEAQSAIKVSFGKGFSAKESLPRLQLVQYGPVYHSVNNFDIWFWSPVSPQAAVAVCQMNTPVGGACWYKGLW